MVHWWKKLTFKDLDAVAEYLTPVRYFEDFSGYCRLRHRGLRSLALDALGRFIEAASKWEPARQRQLALWLARVSSRRQAPDHLCPVPLQQFAVKVCTQWAEDVEDARPHCVLGIMTGADEAFKRALELDPGLDFARAACLRRYVQLLSWAAGWLPEHFYGIPEEVLADTYAGFALIEGFVKPKAYTSLIEDFYALRATTEAYRQTLIAKGHQSYWSPYIRIQRERSPGSDDFD